MNSKLLVVCVLALVALFAVSFTHAYEDLSSEEYSSEVFSNTELESADISPKQASLELAQTLQAERLTAHVGLSAAGFAYARNNLFGGRLTQNQVDNINAILAACNQWGVTDTRQVAYIFATTIHETANTMAPVREAYWLSEAWRKANLRYYPYYGRGYVQLTWQANYAKAGQKLGLGNQLVNNPDLALHSNIAAPVLVLGSKEGWFTGRKLSDYINGSVTDYVNARRIINGTDKAQLIAGHAQKWHTALGL